MTIDDAVSTSLLNQILSEVKIINGRVRSLEDWRLQHQPWSEEGRVLIQDQTKAIAELKNEMVATMQACQIVPGAIEKTVARVLDDREIMENANRWKAISAGAKAIGWKLATALAMMIFTAIVAATIAAWAVTPPPPAAPWEARMLEPATLLAIGLVASAVVQILKLEGLNKDWAPPAVVIVGGILGVYQGWSQGAAYADWLPLFGEGAVGGLTGSGLYSIYGALKTTYIQPKKPEDA